VCIKIYAIFKKEIARENHAAFFKERKPLYLLKVKGREINPYQL